MECELGRIWYEEGRHLGPKLSHLKAAVVNTHVEVVQRDEGAVQHDRRAGRAEEGEAHLHVRQLLVPMHEGAACTRTEKIDHAEAALSAARHVHVLDPVERRAPRAVCERAHDCVGSSKEGV